MEPTGMFSIFRMLGGSNEFTCRNIRKPRSTFTPKIVATATDGGLDVMVAPGRSIRNWPAGEMKSFLAERQWGAWILENEQVCRKLVSVFVTAMNNDQICLMTEEQLLSDPAPDEPISLRAPLEMIPWLGDVRKGGAGTFWVAPQVVSLLVGIILQHGHLPKSAVTLINRELDPDKRLRSLRGILVVLALVLFGWILLMIDTLIGGKARYHLAIRPQTAEGLVGIFFTWACNLDWGTALSTTIGFLPFSVVILMQFGLFRFLCIFLFLNIFVGIWWIVGPKGTGFCGAEGAIFGEFGYCLLIGIFRIIGVPAWPGLCPPRCRKCCGQWCSPRNWMFTYALRLHTP